MEKHSDCANYCFYIASLIDNYQSYDKIHGIEPPHRVSFISLLPSRLITVGVFILQKSKKNTKKERIRLTTSADTCYSIYISKGELARRYKMEKMIRELRFGKTIDLGYGWTCEKDPYTGFKFRKDGKLVESVVMTDSAVSFAEKNCKAEKSEAEKLCEISKKFFADTKATRKDGSLVIIEIETLSGGDAIRDAGGTRLVTENVTYDFIKSWADKNGTDFETVCKAINF